MRSFNALERKQPSPLRPVAGSGRNGIVRHDTVTIVPVVGDPKICRRTIATDTGVGKDLFNRVPADHYFVATRFFANDNRAMLALEGRGSYGCSGEATTVDADDEVTGKMVWSGSQYPGCIATQQIGSRFEDHPGEQVSALVEIAALVISKVEEKGLPAALPDLCECAVDCFYEILVVLCSEDCGVKTFYGQDG